MSESKTERKKLFSYLEDPLNELGGMTVMVRNFLAELRTKPFYFHLLVEQIYYIGVKSLPLIIITAFSSGMVLSLQYGLGLEKFGGKPYVPRLVASSILREMGPVFTGLMIAARVGAGIASEIGSMVVTQQIDAMRSLGTSPVKRIVIPRILACLISLPILVAICAVIGNIGGLIIGHYELGLDPSFYFRRVMETSKLKDYLTGCGKAIFFALFITIPACYYGLSVKNGTKEVGIATTKAVVAGSLLIFVGDFFLSKLFWIIEKWL